MKGHIRQRSPGSFAIVLDLEDPATGKRRRKWHSFKGTKREAQIECARLISQLKGGAYLEPKKTTLSQFLDRWLDAVKQTVAPRTHERYKEIVDKNIKPLLGNSVLSKLKPLQVSEAYATALTSGRQDGTGGLSPRSVLHIHRVLKQSLKQAVRWEILHRNPADAVDAPKVERAPINAPDINQAVGILEQLRGYRIFIPAVFATYEGMRRGEIAAVRWKRIDFANAKLAIVESAEQTQTGVRYKEPKSGRGRSIDLSQSTIEELKSWRTQQAQEFLKLGVRPNGDTLVCTTAAGEGIQPNSITHEFLKALEAEKLPRIRFHDLRHAHASHMLASGIHPKIVSERLGHSKIGITMDLYSHTIPTMQADAVATMDAAYKAAKRTHPKQKA